MNKSILLNRNLVTFGLPIALFSILIILMQSSLLNGNNVLNLAITADLLLTVPLVYFLLIYKSDIPNTTVIPVMVLGLLIGSYFLPKESQTYLELFKSWVLPFIEVLIVTFVIFKVRKAQKTFDGLKGDSLDFYTTVKNTCNEVLPQKLAVPFATEVAIIYYGFIHWKTRKLSNNEFSYHKKSGTPALFGALIFIIGIETFTVHILIERWNMIIAWILTGLSIYTAIQFFGFAKSLSQRPILLTHQKLILKYGVFCETEILFADISNIELSRKALSKDALSKKLSPLGDLESHNVIIHLKKVSELSGLYGIKKRFKTIALHLDEPNDFKEMIENSVKRISNTAPN